MLCEMQLACLQNFFPKFAILSRVSIELKSHILVQSNIKHFYCIRCGLWQKFKDVNLPL